MTSSVRVLVRPLTLFVSLAMLSCVVSWGPAAFADDDDLSVPVQPEQTATSRKTDRQKAIKRPAVKKSRKRTAVAKPKSIAKPAPSPSIRKSAPKLAPKPVPRAKPRSKKASVDETMQDIESDNESVGDSKELAIRVVGISKVLVRKEARSYIPRDFENRLTERLIQDLTAKAYLEPTQVEGALSLRSPPSAIAEATKRADSDGLLIFEIGLEEINGALTSGKGREVATFKSKYLVGELESANAVSVITDRLVQAVVQSIPYRGFVTKVSASGKTAIVNLGTSHSVGEGELLELFEFRRDDFMSPRRRLFDVVVKKVTGSHESEVAVLDEDLSDRRIPEFSKVSFSLAPKTAESPPIVEATSASAVSGRWWFGFGGELNSYGADAAAPQYESRVFKVNGSPFGYLSAGNDQITLRGAFGSARSVSETLGFFDVQGTYNLYQVGSAQSAWTIAAGLRVFLIQVKPTPNNISALESTNIISPVVEVKYSYIPRGRIRLIGLGEVFWPIYSSGASPGALPFAFGGGLGGGLQIALTPKFGFEVSGRIRYLRRVIDGQSGIQERQTTLSTGLLFSF